MTNKTYMRSAMMIAFLAASVASHVALAVDEVEPNDPSINAQPLVPGTDGTMVVNGGILNMPTHRDVDYYSFHANEGDVLTIDIDGGIDANYVGVWTFIALFGPDGTNPVPVDQSVSGVPIDPGSVNEEDARIDGYVVPKGGSGTYIVGVSSYPAGFTSIDHLSSIDIYENSPYIGVNGTYTLTISGASSAVSTPPPPPPVQQIGIEIRPGSRDVIWAYATSDRYFRYGRHYGRGHDSERKRDPDRVHDIEVLRSRFRNGIPVALLSSDTFDAMDVDPTSVKFGIAGDEESLIRCNRHGVDVNHDKLPDLICTFDFRKAGFEPGDNQGIVTGTTNSGLAFQGQGWLKIVTGIRHHEHGGDHDHDHDRDRHHRR
jgi:hypothetical protein